MSNKTQELMMMVAEIRNAFGVFTLENLGEYIDENYVPREEYEKLQEKLTELSTPDPDTPVDTGFRFNEDRPSGAV